MAANCYSERMMEYEIIRSSRKTAAIQIKDGRVIVRAPHFASNKDIRGFVESNSEWISKHLAMSEERRAEASYKLSQAELKALYSKAAEVIPERVEYFAPLVGVRYGRITIRRQRTKWGSCSSKGNLNFNCLLMLAPPEVIDGVVVHELCHLKEMNHSERFYAEVNRVYPGYAESREWLKAHGRELMAMLDD